MSAETAMKTYTKTKSKFDGLVKSYKPYKASAIQNADKVNLELKTSMTNLDTEINGFDKKLTSFPTASAYEQIAMASTMKDDYVKVKTSTDAVTKSIKGMSLPKMPKL